MRFAGDAHVRPDDLTLHRTAIGTDQTAMVDRVVHFGFAGRVEVVSHDG